MNIKEYLKSKAEIVEKSITGYLEELHYPEVIADGMRYAVLNGGKRIRPVLLLMVLELLKCKKEKGMATAAAIEMIHSYSLVHDDLPPLDNDDYRRGKLTTHKKFGEAEGILIGDALLTHAFYILSEKNIDVIESSKIVKIISKTAEYSGVNGMIGGQMVDIDSEGKRIELPVLQYIHTHKTGKLLRLPVEAGIIIAEATAKQEEVLKEYAELIGLAFQIKDDILDIEGDFEKIGKPVASDLKLEKSTYPSIFGLEQSKEILKEKVERAKKIINDEFGKDGIWFVKLAEYIAEREM